MRQRKKNIQRFLKLGKNENFLGLVKLIEGLAAKVLTVALLIVILFTLIDLIVVLVDLLLFFAPYWFF